MPSQDASYSLRKDVPLIAKSPRKVIVRVHRQIKPEPAILQPIPSAPAANTPVTPSDIPETSDKLVDSNAFLTTLATQERRVLELREELQKAEEDLEKLKKRWTTHEVTNKGTEVRHAEQLQPLRISPSQRMKRDIGCMARPSPYQRQKVSKSGSQQPQRKVFSGSRKTRALSLLSPDPFGEKGRIQSPTEKFHSVNEGMPATTLLRSSTTPGHAPTFNIAYHSSPKIIPKDALLETGKQLVGDLRGGLWTFFEDLRQATVGEEAIGATMKARPTKCSRSRDPTKQASRAPCESKSLPGQGRLTHGNQVTTPRVKINGDTKGSAELKSSVDDHFEQGIKDESQCLIPRSDTPPQHGEGPDDGGWDNWDSPKSRTQSPHHCFDSSSCTPCTENSPSTGRSSLRTSIRYQANVQRLRVHSDNILVRLMILHGR